MAGTSDEWTDRVKQAHELYGISTRTLRSWITKARKVRAEPPPLLDPVAMIAWWPSVYSTDPREEILRAAGQGVSPPEESTLTPTDFVELDGDAPDFDAANLRGFALAISAKHREYHTETDPMKKRKALDEWVKLTEQKRKLDKEFEDLNIERGIAIKKTELIPILHQAFGPIAELVRNGYSRLCTETATVPDPNLERAWRDLADETMAGLQENNFGLS